MVQAGDAAPALAGLAVQRVEADIRDAPALVGAFAGADRVFHLAGIVSITQAQQARMREVNVEGTRAVVAACREARVGRLVHTGSVHALTEPAGDVLDETAGYDPRRASGAYGKTKAEACALVERAAQAGELDAVLVLPTGVVGPFDTRVSELGQVLSDLEHGRLPFLLPGGHDWVDVRDVAQGIWLAATRGAAGRSYLLGGEYVSLRDIAVVVAEQTGARVPPVLPRWVAPPLAALAPAFEALTHRRALLTPYALHAVSVPFTVSHARASRELGYEAGPVRQALRDAIAWRAAQLTPARPPGPGRAPPRASRVPHPALAVHR